MTAYERVVHGERGAAGGEAEHGVRPASKQRLDRVGDDLGGAVRRRRDHDFHRPLV
jgi:hypothetical protein